MTQNNLSFKDISEIIDSPESVISELDTLHIVSPGLYLTQALCKVAEAFDLIPRSDEDLNKELSEHRSEPKPVSEDDAKSLNLEQNFTHEVKTHEIELPRKKYELLVPTHNYKATSKMESFTYLESEFKTEPIGCRGCRKKTIDSDSKSCSVCGAKIVLLKGV